MLRVLFLLTVTCVCHLTSSPTGPPEDACEMMIPKHGVSAQLSTSPYTLTVPQDTYAPNEVITVTLSGTPDFKGFFIQARPANGSTWVTYGSFRDKTGTKNPCANVPAGNSGATALPRNAAISHNNNNTKSSISVSWTAPASDVSDIQFLYTVVQSGKVFWTLQTSTTLTFSSNPVPTSPFTSTVTIPPSTAAPTQPPPISPPGTIQRDPQCGVTVSCFPDTCTTDCDYLVTWRKLDDSDVEFTMKKQTRVAGYYFAIGFSDDAVMGEDSVTECLLHNGSVTIKSSFNKNVDDFKYNDPMTPSDYGLSGTTGSFADGILSCTFRRKINAVLANAASVARKRRAVQGSADTFFDLSSPWFLFAAYGLYDGSVKSEHSDTARSPVKYNFLAVTEEPVTAEPQTGSVTKAAGCGTTLGCFSKCYGDMCDFLFTWRDEGDNVAITMSAKLGANSYFAVGMSADDKMGDDSVTECTSSGGNVNVYVSYNDGQTNERLDVVQFGLTGISGSHEDGVLACSFSRKKTAALASGGSMRRRKRAVTADASTFFDMEKDWTLFAAMGQSIAGTISKHSSTPLVSPTQADFQSFDDIGAEAPKHALVKAHGILMVVAWMFCSSLGILMARFYKDVWPEGSDWCGQKRWFVVHRGMMMLAFLASAAGFVLIFIHVEGWAEIDGPTFHQSHPIVGTIVMGLALINPIMAFFRPHPGTPKRPIFKAAHTIVGIGACVLGVINIVSGTLLSAANVAEYTTYIVYGFIGWVALIDIILVIYDCSKAKRARSENYEMGQPGSGSYGKSNQGVDKLKVFILVLHVPIVLALAVSACVIIGVVEKDGGSH